MEPLSFATFPPGRYDLIAHMHALTDAKQTVEVTAGGTVEANFRLASRHSAAGDHCYGVGS